MPAQRRFTRALGRLVLRLGGWRVVGEIPDLPRLVLIAAPHSSNWDGIWGMAAKMALGFDVRVLGKDSLFWWPLSIALHLLGVTQLALGRVAEARDTAQGALGLAPADADLHDLLARIELHAEEWAKNTRVVSDKKMKGEHQ